MGAGLYLHVPFCRRKCPYCNFYSVPAQPELLTAYTAAVCRNLRHYGNAAQPERVDTVYFGGGTPSLLLPAQIAQILETAAEQFALSADAEITLEANPATVTPEQLRELRHAGINRLSLGVQSLSDAQLKRLGRLHTAQEAVKTVYAAAEAGFRNLSCDLMLALPEQTADELEQTVSRLVQLPITHVSAYLLKVEQGTPFAVQHVRAGTTASTGTANPIWASDRLHIPAGTASGFLCRLPCRIFWSSRCSQSKPKTKRPAHQRKSCCWACG